jgi:DNA replication protein DnaD
MEKKGYIRLYRKIMDNGMYFSEPFTRTQAWIDLLLLANHKAKNVYLRGVCVTIGRGQVGHSMKELADRWSWSIGKVNRFIDRLKTDEQIDSQKTNVTTIISILNWDEYQSSESADESADGNQTETDGNQTEDQTETNKNDKNLIMIIIPIPPLYPPKLKKN